MKYCFFLVYIFYFLKVFCRSAIIRFSAAACTAFTLLSSVTILSSVLCVIIMSAICLSLLLTVVNLSMCFCISLLPCCSSRLCLICHRLAILAIIAFASSLRSSYSLAISASTPAAFYCFLRHCLLPCWFPFHSMRNN